MSTTRHTHRGSIAQGINKFLAVLGQAPVFQVNEFITPTIDLVAGRDWPFQNYAVPVFGHTGAAAVAAEYTYGWISPGPDTALEVRGITIANTGAALQRFSIKLLTAADIAAISATATQHMVCGTQTDLAITFPQNAGATQSHGSDAGDIGTIIDQVYIGNGVSYQYKFDPAFMLWSVKREGSLAKAIAVKCEGVFSPFGMSAQGREWPVP